jgi:hypothetical protein
MTILNPSQPSPSHRAEPSDRARIAAGLLAILFATGLLFGVWWWILRDSPRGSAASGTSPLCTASAAPTTSQQPSPANPRKVTINVYNGTRRGGLASSTAKALEGRGFIVGRVANDPLGKPIAGVVEIRVGPQGAAGASAVTLQVTDAKVVVDSRTDASVDLVLGVRYTSLRSPAEVAKATAAIADQPTPPPCK